MTTLFDYIKDHTIGGACQCGRCADAVENPESEQPAGHTADVVFFKVALKGEPDAATLKVLIAAHPASYGDDIDLFDGEEHSYLEVGGWLGDQGAALGLMGMGSLLGLWSLITPRTVFGTALSDDLVQQMAGIGLVIVMAPTADEVQESATGESEGGDGGDGE